MENLNELSLGGLEVDLTKVSALNHRRSVTFMNNFLINTTNFLNNFSTVAEENLAKQSEEMQKLEIALNILEAKLDSIPGLDNITASSSNITPANENPPKDVDSSDVDANPLPTPAVESPDIGEETVLKVKDDPRYSKYLKMFSVGVPKIAIEGKMRMEGLDPNLLETPNAAVPDPPANLASDSDNESNSLSSGDDFSD